jgi:hypothetical protein
MQHAAPRTPVVSLRSTTGYWLRTLRVQGVRATLSRHALGFLIPEGS